jgi:2'-5' RNA ligase
MKQDPDFYFLLITPPPDVIEDAIFFKAKARTLLGHSYRSFHSVPHMTLHQYRDFQERKLYIYNDIISRTASFNIFIEDFGVFEGNGTIFLKTVFDDEIRSLCRQLRGNAITPHITIARRLAQHDRDQVWASFKGISYRRHFLCDRITVLKRFRQRWHKHSELPLGTATTGGKNQRALINAEGEQKLAHLGWK